MTRRVEPAGPLVDARMSEQELRSLTGGKLRISDADRRTYVDALRALEGAGVEFVLSGLFGVYAYTGISRPVNDLDVLLEPTHVLRAARALAAQGFETCLVEPHWLAKARRENSVVDLVYGMANGLFLIDEAWTRRGWPGVLDGEPVLLASPEDLIFHRLFINERHRFDMSDIVHLLLVCHEHMDWHWLLERLGEHWPLLLAQILFFDFSYPRRRRCIPEWVREDLHRRHAGRVVAVDRGREPCRGTLISRYSFAVDVNEWDFRDSREEAVEATLRAPVIRRIANDPVWCESGGDAA